MKLNFSFFCYLMLSISSTYAQAYEQRLYKDAASMGMGGVGVSSIGYSFSVIHNPANLGLMNDHDISPFISLGMSVNPDMFRLLDQVKPVIAGTADFDAIDFDSLIGNATSIGINGPLSAGYMGKGFGFWTTTSADIAFAVQENKNSVFAQNNLDINYNNLASAGSEILDIVNGGGSIGIEKAKEIFNKYLQEDLINSGLTDKEAMDLVNHLANQVAGDPAKAEEAIKGLLPLAKVNMTAEITLNLAYGYQFLFSAIDDVSGISFGATIRFSQRFKSESTGGDNGFLPVDKLATQYSSILDNVYQAGSISSDFGMSLRIENWILGIVVRDAFSTGYSWKNLDGLSGGLEKSKIPFTLEFGTSYRFYFNNKFIQEVAMYLEFTDATSKVSSWSDKLRLGAEVKLFNFLDLRLGMYDTFVTGGIGMGWKWGRIDFAYYRENYFDLFTSDQYYLNFTVGLDNSPRRKAQSIQKQLEQDRIQSQALDLINSSLEGIEN